GGWRPLRGPRPRPRYGPRAPGRAHDLDRGTRRALGTRIAGNLADGIRQQARAELPAGPAALAVVIVNGHLRHRGGLRAERAGADDRLHERQRIATLGTVGHGRTIRWRRGIGHACSLSARARPSTSCNIGWGTDE